MLTCQVVRCSEALYTMSQEADSMRVFGDFQTFKFTRVIIQCSLCNRWALIIRSRVSRAGAPAPLPGMGVLYLVWATSSTTDVADRHS
jgi:hypothetical protein